MRRRAIVVIPMFVALALPPPTLAAPIRECGSHGDKGNGVVGWTYGQIRGAGIFNLTTRRVWCSVARRVALRAYNTYEGGKTWRWKGWRCRILRSAHEFADTRCKKRRAKVVRWQSGA